MDAIVVRCDDAVEANTSRSLGRYSTCVVRDAMSNDYVESFQDLSQRGGRRKEFAVDRFERVEGRRGFNRCP